MVESNRFDLIPSHLGLSDGRVEGGPRQNNAELLSPVPTNHRRMREDVFEDTRYLSEDFITHLMSVLVVDTFEVIDIDHQTGDGCGVAARSLPQRFESFQQGTPIQAAGQRIVGREDLELTILGGDFIPADS